MSTADEKLDPADVATCLRVLETLHGDRPAILEIPEAERERLLLLAGYVNMPLRSVERRTAKARRRLDRKRRKDHDDVVVAGAAMRQVLQLPVYVALPAQ